MKTDIAGSIGSENLDMQAKVHPKILCARVVVLLVQRDAVYQNITMKESMTSEEEFKTLLTSSSNQIAFICSLTKNFLRTADGPSPFFHHLWDSAEAVASFMPNWLKLLKQKVKGYAVFGAVVRMLNQLCNDSTEY